MLIGLFFSFIGLFLGLFCMCTYVGAFETESRLGSKVKPQGMYPPHMKCMYPPPYVGAFETESWLGGKVKLQRCFHTDSQAVVAQRHVSSSSYEMHVSFSHGQPSSSCSEAEILRSHFPRTSGGKSTRKVNIRWEKY